MRHLNEENEERNERKAALSREKFVQLERSRDGGNRHESFFPEKVRKIQKTQSKFIPFKFISLSNMYRSLSKLADNTS